MVFQKRSLHHRKNVYLAADLTCKIGNFGLIADDGSLIYALCLKLSYTHAQRERSISAGQRLRH